MDVSTKVQRSEISRLNILDFNYITATAFSPSDASEDL